jgi:rubredoxin
MPEMMCPVCGKETLVIKEPVYEGFTRAGERMKCAVCGHRFEASVETAPAKKTPAIFTEEDRPVAIKIFDEGENRTICRYCKNYLVNPFTQRCSLHNKEVEATDTCRDFEASGKDQKT